MAENPRGPTDAIRTNPSLRTQPLAAPIRITEYARLRGVSDEAVRKAIKSGRLTHCVVEVKGKPWIGDVALANREWELNTDTKHHRKDAQPSPLSAQAAAYLGPDAAAVKVVLPNEQATPTPQPARLAAKKAPSSRPPAKDTSSWINPNAAPIDPSTFDDPNQIDPSTGVPRVMVSRARKEHFDAVHAQAKAELLAGTQVNREEVTRAAFNVAREVRDALFLIKDRLADELATMTDPNAISAYLDTEFRNALTKLAGEIVLERPDVG